MRTKSLLTSAICVLSAFTIPVTTNPSKTVAQTYERNNICTNATLNGEYAFELTGFIGTTAPFTPAVALRRTSLDGAGNWSGRGFGVAAGVVSERRLTGTYQVQNNCTVTFNYSTFRLNGTKTDDDRLFGVITDNGDKVRVVLTKDTSGLGTFNGFFEKLR